MAESCEAGVRKTPAALSVCLSAHGVRTSWFLPPPPLPSTWLFTGERVVSCVPIIQGTVNEPPSIRHFFVLFNDYLEAVFVTVVVYSMKYQPF